MRTFRILLWHELRSLAIATPTYVAAAIFLALMGAMYFALLKEAQLATLDHTPVERFFQLFALPLFFIVPLLTMRSFAEERRQGTLGALLSTPVRPVHVVLAKFGAAYLLYVGLWALALLYPAVTWWLLKGLYNDPRLLALPALKGGFLFIMVSGLLYIATGVLASSLTRSTLVAGLLAFCALFFLVLLGSLLQQVPFDAYTWARWLEQPAEYFNTFKHLDAFTRGIVDTRPVFLFGSGALLALGLTVLTVESKV